VRCLYVDNVRTLAYLWPTFVSMGTRKIESTVLLNLRYLTSRTERFMYKHTDICENINVTVTRWQVYISRGSSHVIYLPWSGYRFLYYFWQTFMPHFASMLRLTQMATSFIVLAWVKILFSYLIRHHLTHIDNNLWSLFRAFR